MEIIASRDGKLCKVVRLSLLRIMPKQNFGGICFIDIAVGICNQTTLRVVKVSFIRPNDYFYIHELIFFK